jgi:hypothetical protein
MRETLELHQLQKTLFDRESQIPSKQRAIDVALVSVNHGIHPVGRGAG